MRAIILAASLAAMMASATIMAQESLAASSRRPHVPPAPMQGIPDQSTPFHLMSECSDPGAHIWCPPAPNHMNDAAESAGT
jgi:hypothetical protein